MSFGSLYWKSHWGSNKKTVFKVQMEFTLLRVQRAMSGDVVCMETDAELDCNREMAS